MKNIMSLAKVFIALAGVIVFLFSCKKQELFRDAQYPGQVIYLPAAVNGIFVINSIPERIGNVPTPGMASRFRIDSANNKFVVPLGVFRGGIDNKGAAKVKIVVNTDTISKLSAAGKFTGNLSGAQLLPADKYMIPSDIDLLDGAELATFELKVDMAFLLANKGKIYAVGVSVSSAEIKANPQLNTAVLVIDTRFLVPAAAFTGKIDAADDRKINFTNSSASGVSYSWNFGDNTAVSTEKNPSHTFTTYGNHTITLTTKGITGEVSVATNVMKLYENVTNTYFKNPGAPFLRKDAGTGRWGLLKDWIYTDNVPNQNGYTLGGFSNDDGSGYIHFESTDWSGPGLTNGKVYQTFTLPPGEYRAEFKLQNSGGDNLNANFVVAMGAVLPDVNSLNDPSVLGKYSWDGSKTDFGTFGVNFIITQSTQVTIGFVMNFGTFSYTRIAKVNLIK